MIKPGVPEANGTITQHYYSYLIRIWQGENALPGGWHASLEDPSTKHTNYFTKIEDLFTYINNLARVNTGTPTPQDEPEVQDSKQ